MKESAYDYEGSCVGPLAKKKGAASSEHVSVFRAKIYEYIEPPFILVEFYHLDNHLDLDLDLESETLKVVWIFII